MYSILPIIRHTRDFNDAELLGIPDYRFIFSVIAKQKFAELKQL